MYTRARKSTIVLQGLKEKKDKQKERSKFGRRKRLNWLGIKTTFFTRAKSVCSTDPSCSKSALVEQTYKTCKWKIVTAEVNETIENDWIPEEYLIIAFSIWVYHALHVWETWTIIHLIIAKNMVHDFRNIKLETNKHAFRYFILQPEWYYLYTVKTQGNAGLMIIKTPMHWAR